MNVRRLEVWLEDEHVASIDAIRPWELRLRYSGKIVDRIPSNGPFLSCSLLVSRSKQNATFWARGLLPEGAHLQAMAARAGVPTSYIAHLLAQYGRDVAGAFTITTGPPPDPQRWAQEEYTDDDLATELRNAATEPGFATRSDSELSLAGLQNKLLVVRTRPGRWARPVNGRPSTHIMKLDDPRRPGLVEAEHSCLLLAAALGLTTISPEFIHVDGMSVLVVDRYDRTLDASGVTRRIHQEDACQALAIDLDAARGRGKYEADGGPTYAAIARLLRQHSGQPYRAELAQLLRLAAFTSVIGNADGHGKNVSFIIDTLTGTISLAPAYDTVPTALWPELRKTQSMSVAGRFSAEPSVDDFVSEATSWGLSRPEAIEVIATLASDLCAAARSLRIRADVAELVVNRAAPLLA